MARYLERAFDAKTIQEARGKILTPCGDLTTDRRWETETPLLMNLIREKLTPTSESVIMDYGCGIGRISREIIREFGSTLIGVDISLDMIGFSYDYVDSRKWFPYMPQMLTKVTGLDAAVSIWCLQHVKYLNQDVERIRLALKPGGKLFLVNNEERCIPTDWGWGTDGFKIRDILTKWFQPLEEGKLDPAVVGEDISEQTFWGLYVAI